MIRNYYRKNIGSIIHVGSVKRDDRGRATISGWYIDGTPGILAGWTIDELEEISLMNAVPLNWELVF